MTEQRAARPSRRAVITGIGVVGGAGLLSEATAHPASAAKGPGSTGVHPMPPTGFHPISSPPQPNVSYQFRSYWDFSPANNLAAGRVRGGPGVYTNVSSDALVATFDAEPGVILHDVEWYVANTSATIWGVDVWGAGLASGVQLVAGNLAAGTGSIEAIKVAIPSSVNGPYPAGTRFATYMFTPTDGSVQINGVRLGFTHGALHQVMRDSPVRVYDSRSHTHLGGGASRTISLAGYLPAGAQAATLALSVLNTYGAGVLQVSPAGSTSVAFAASWARTGDKSTNTLVSDVSASRAVSVSSAHGSGRTDFILDLIGWVV
jgi:hypothetical protein